MSRYSNLRYSCPTFQYCFLSKNKRFRCPCRECLVKIICNNACDELKRLKNSGFIDGKIAIDKNYDDL